MKSIILWSAILGSVSLGRTANAAITVGFAGEPGGNFSSFDNGGLYTVVTSASGLDISKPADDGSLNPNGFVEAGLTSNFTFSGDFTIAVNFTLPDLPFPAGQEQLNESLLTVTDNSGDFFEVLRFTTGGGRNLVEAFSNPFVNLPTLNSSLTSGIYRIERVGSTITGSYAATGSSTFTSLGSASGFSAPMHLGLIAAQGENSGSRSTTALDIGFNGLTIQADGFQGVVPEPSSYLLWGLFVAFLIGNRIPLHNRQRPRRPTPTVRRATFIGDTGGSGNGSEAFHKLGRPLERKASEGGGLGEHPSPLSSRAKDPLFAVASALATSRAITCPDRRRLGSRCRCRSRTSRRATDLG